MCGKRRVRAVVTGRTQGVGFRYFVLDRAHQLGLRGWVRNVGRGQVEVLAEGNQEAVEELLQALRQGPRLAWVQDVTVEYHDYLGDLDSFIVESTVW